MDILDDVGISISLEEPATCYDFELQHPPSPPPASPAMAPNATGIVVVVVVGVIFVVGMLIGICLYMRNTRKPPSAVLGSKVPVGRMPSVSSTSAAAGAEMKPDGDDKL